MRTEKSLRLVKVAWVVLVALMLSPPAFSQGCPLCYTQAAASGARMIRALRSGIVILIIPPLSMCLGAIVLAYRKRDQFNRAAAGVEPGSDW
ncbi:MAG: hypothetical protein ACLP6G_06385 [Terriglobales bacterium]